MLFMITLTRFNGTTIMLNENFIEIAEETPDTVVTALNFSEISIFLKQKK